MTKISAGKGDTTLSAFDLTLDWSEPYGLWAGLVGGAFLSMATHGTDHLIVQRLLAAGSLGNAQKAIVFSGVVVLAQFALFLTVGLGLHAYYEGRTFAVPDEIFPLFIVEGLPAGKALDLVEATPVLGVALLVISNSA